MSGTKPIKLVSRLHFKIALFVIATIIVIFGLFSAYQLISYSRTLTDMVAGSSELLTQMLTSSLEIAMLNSDLQAIQYSFEEISQDENIRTVFLMNMAGEVRASSQVGLIGLRMTRQNYGCRECHTSDADMPLSTILERDGEHILRVVAPIENKPQCHSCHNPAARWNGMLVLDQSLEPVHSEILSTVERAGLTAGGAVLIMMLVFRWHIKKHVISRVEYLESLARRIADSDLSCDIALPGNDELSSLAGSLNNMKDSLKLSLRAAEDHHNYLSHLLDNLLDGIIIVSSERRVAFINHSFSRVLGVDESAVRCDEVLDFVRPPLNKFPRLLGLIERAQDADDPVQDVIKLGHTAVDAKYLEVHVGVLKLPPKREVEIIIVVRDITERVMIENQIYQSEKLATVGRLAAGIAHEINNPMATILTCAEGLLERDSGEGDTRDYLDIIKNSAQRCKIITQKLLDYSAVPTTGTDPVCIHDVVAESISLLRFEAERKSVTIRLHADERDGTVMGTRDSLVQVFVNLMLNSIQAMGSGGEIIVELRHVDGNINVMVNDNGPGIDVTNRERVFEPFFTTKPIGQGTGLGLSVSLAIVNKFGGTIDIPESRKGFTSVRVSLPRAPKTTLGTT